MRIVGILVATILFFGLGFLWYGVLFKQVWLDAKGLTKDQFDGQSPLWMLGGPLIPLFVSIGMSKVMEWRGWPDTATALLTGLKLGIFFAIPMAAYELFYSLEHSLPLFLVDASHMVVGWLIVAFVTSKLH